jgi:hypothetical protein
MTTVTQPEFIAIYDYKKLIEELDARFETRVQAEVEKRMATKQYYSMGEVSTIFGKSSKTIERWHKAGVLCYSTVTEEGGKMFYIDDINATHERLRREREKRYRGEV